MLEGLPAETITCQPLPSSSSSSAAIFSLVPRQVALAKRHQTMKNNKDSSQTLQNGSIDQNLVVESVHKDKTKKKKEKKNKCRDPSPLLLSIAAYLQHNGFTQTLAAFQSETSIAELDDSNIHALDLELYYKYLETSKSDAKSNNKGSEELDMPNAAATSENQAGSKCASPEEPSVKNKKKRSNEDGVGKVDEQPGYTDELTKSGIDSDEKSTKSHVKKKKNKLGSDSLDVASGTILETTDKELPEPQLDASDRKSKDKKKKNKIKSIVAEKDESETCSHEGKSLAVKGPSDILLEDKKLKSKDKKRKDISSEHLDDQETKKSDQVDVGNNGAKKESFSTLEDNIVGIDKKSSKKRKKMTSEGGGSQPTDDGTQSAVSGEKDKANELLESNGHTGKKRKTENGQVDPEKPLKASSGQMFAGSLEGTTTPKASGDQSKTELHTNGDLEKTGREGSAASKSTKKQKPGSAEPKTVNAFRRVKVDEVEFADDRLQDNSYWAKDGAEIGYGAKAQEVLGQVRGRDFRHEKTKKKRGSYRGGQIDFQTHSVKFNYSDEE